MKQSKLLKNIKHASWFRPGVKILCACSGGIDSSVLLHLLTQCPEIELSIIHFDHQFRGKESDGDRIFVQELGEMYGVCVHIITENISEYAHQNQLSFEEAGSRRRNKAYHATLNKIGYDYIATAHHLDDQIETLLINIYHGTGIRGLSGMSKVNNKILRPLLSHPKSDLEAYASINSLTYRVDHSNASLYFLRNNIRLKLLPKLNSQNDINIEGLIYELNKHGTALFKMIAKSLEVADNIDIRLSNIAKIPLGMGKMSNYFSPIQKVIFDRAFQSISLTPQGLSSAHFLVLQSLYPESAIGSEIHLPLFVSAFRIRTGIVFIKREEYEWDSAALNVADVETFPFFNIEVHVLDVKQNVEDSCCFWYRDDLDKYTLRPVQNGDVMTVSTSGKVSSVKQILQEAHLAPHLKEYFPVVEYGGRIQWIPGVRTAPAAMVDLAKINEKDLKHCIKVNFQKGTFE